MSEVSLNELKMRSNHFLFGVQFLAIISILLLTTTTTQPAAVAMTKLNSMHRFVHSGNELNRTRMTIAYYTFGRRGPGDKFLSHDKYFNYNLDERQNFTFVLGNHDASSRKSTKNINFIRVSVLQDSRDGSAELIDTNQVSISSINSHFCAASVQFYGNFN